MIQVQTRLKVADNSGAKTIQCIRVLGASVKRYARIGELITASVKEAEPRATVANHEVVRAVIVRQRQPLRRVDGSTISFDDNAAVIISKETGEPRGTRVFGPVARELREKGYSKIVSLAPEVL